MATPALQARAKQFLARPIPEELKPTYAPGSLADIVVTQCAKGEAIDGELLELAEMAAMTYEDAIADAKTTELKDYYTECQSILQELVASA